MTAQDYFVIASLVATCLALFIIIWLDYSENKY